MCIYHVYMYVFICVYSDSERNVEWCLKGGAKKLVEKHIIYMPMALKILTGLYIL